MSSIEIGYPCPVCQERIRVEVPVADGVIDFEAVDMSQMNAHLDSHDTRLVEVDAYQVMFGGAIDSDGVKPTFALQIVAGGELISLKFDLRDAETLVEAITGGLASINASSQRGGS